MSKCMVCGTANSPDSSVCAKCGNKLRVNRNQSTKKKKKSAQRSKKPEIREEIYSKSDHDIKEVKEEPIKDLFSSDAAYEKAKNGNVLEKIHKFEEVIGDTSEVVEEEQKIVPKVINRETSYDIIKTSPAVKNPKDKRHDIPHRVIRSVKTTDGAGGTRYVERDGENKKRLHNEKLEHSAQVEKAPVTEVKESEARDTEKKTKKRPSVRKQKSEETVAAMSIASSASHKSASIESAQVKEPELEEEKVAIAENNAPEHEAAPEAKIEEELLELTENVTEKAELPEDEETEKPVDTEEDEIGESEPEQQPKQEEKAAEEPKQAMKAAEEPQPEAAPETQEEEPVVRSRVIPEVASRLKAEKEAAKASASEKPVKKAMSKKTVKPVDDDTEKKPVKTKKTSEKSEADPAAPKKRPKKTGTGKRKKPRFTQEDIDSNKYAAAMSYLGVLILIPFFRRSRSKFCRAHLKQGLAVLIWSLCISVITLAAVLGLRALILWALGLNVVVYKIAAYIISAVMLTLIFIPVFEGAVNAFGGTYAKVPFVGRFVKSKKKQK